MTYSWTVTVGACIAFCLLKKNWRSFYFFVDKRSKIRSMHYYYFHIVTLFSL